MNISVIVGICSGIVGIIVTLLTLYPNIKKTKAEIDKLKAEKDNIQVSTSLELIAELRKSLNESKEASELYRKENEKLIIQISNLETKVDILTQKFEAADSIKCELLECKKRIPPVKESKSKSKRKATEN